MRRYGVTYPVISDGSNAVFTAYGLQGLPETFFLDGQGRVRVHWIGEIFASELEQGVNLLQAPSRTPTPAP